MSVKGISIILCTYNGATLLEETLAHLSQLVIPESTNVEFLFVDNASTDDSAKAANDLWCKYSIPFPMKLLVEPKPGLLYARKNGIKSSRYDILLFVDDDNWLAPDYLQKMLFAFTRWPNAGAIGGFNKPVFGGTEPFWFKDFKFSYAVGKLAEVEGPPWEIGLFGAGLVVKKSALNDLYAKGFESKLIGRNGESLSSGEDYEICKALKIAGWDIIYIPEMKLQHFIPESRLSWDYYKKLNQGISNSIIYFLAYEYWIVKGNARNRFITWLNYTWIIQTIKKWGKIFFLKMSLFINPGFKSEGSKTLMELERSMIVAKDLINKRKEFLDLKKSIRDAGWRT